MINFEKRNLRSDDLERFVRMFMGVVRAHPVHALHGQRHRAYGLRPTTHPLPICHVPIVPSLICTTQAKDRGLDLGSRLPPMDSMDPPHSVKTAGVFMERELQRMLGDKYGELDLVRLCVVWCIDWCTAWCSVWCTAWCTAWCVAHLPHHSHAPPDEVLCILPYSTASNGNLYEAVKRWSEATTGIPVQCCRADKITGNGKKALGQDKQYHAGTPAVPARTDQACSPAALQPPSTRLPACEQALAPLSPAPPRSARIIPSQALVLIPLWSPQA